MPSDDESSPQRACECTNHAIPRAWCPLLVSYFYCVTQARSILPASSICCPTLRLVGWTKRTGLRSRRRTDERALNTFNYYVGHSLSQSCTTSPSFAPGREQTFTTGNNRFIVVCCHFFVPSSLSTTITHHPLFKRSDPCTHITTTTTTKNQTGGSNSAAATPPPPPSP